MKTLSISTVEEPKRKEKTNFLNIEKYRYCKEGYTQSSKGWVREVAQIYISFRATSGLLQNTSRSPLILLQKTLTVIELKVI